MLAICFLLVLWSSPAALANRLTASVERKYCLVSDNNPYLLFGTKTFYDVVRGTAGSETVCYPVQIWSLNRHGTRYPSHKNTLEMKGAIELKKKILNNYAKNYNTSTTDGLCFEDLSQIDRWTWNSSIESMSYFLTPTGWQELKSIAKRYQRRYPSLLGEKYSEDDFYFHHTNEQRTKESCKAHIEGLFGTYEGIKIEDPLKDHFFRSYKTCDAWKINVSENNNFWKAEQVIFRNQADYLKLSYDVSKRLGFEVSLEHEDIDRMYDNCRFDKSWKPGKVSPWCSVFTKSELHLLEYHDDLGKYYRSGYGHEFNTRLGCIPLKHMMTLFNNTIHKSEAKPKVIALFSHDTMINMVLTKMGFAEDQQQLKGSHYEDLLLNRKFRPSANMPFSANIVAILHKCSDIEYEVQFFINERPMDLPGCPRGLCTWGALLELLPDIASCNLDFCHVPNTA